jgi:predicted ribonuclease YlaK
MQYFFDQQSGTVVPLSVLEELDTSDQDAVSAIFAKPVCRLIGNLTRYMRDTPSLRLQERADDILTAAKHATLNRASLQSC